MSPALRKQEPLAVGQRFGRLTVQRDYPRPVSDSHIEVRCDCGTTKTVRLHNLLRNTRSCGCLLREQMAERGRERVAHGHCRNGTATRTYSTWVSMIKRCANPKTSGYANYGGRGITVCQRWRTFDNFLADMGERPDGKSLDRIDPNGNYEPGNCRWSTPREQQLGTRRALGLASNPTVREVLDEAGVPGNGLAPRVAYLVALLKRHDIPFD